jgi:hypothetical protein
MHGRGLKLADTDNGNHERDAQIDRTKGSLLELGE